MKKLIVGLLAALAMWVLPGTARAKRVTIIHTFSSNAQLGGGIVAGPDGTLYGTTLNGGTGCGRFGCGTIYALAPPAQSGEAWTYTTLYDFGTGVHEGYGPEGQLTLGPAGELYGYTTSNTLFRLSPPASGQSGWTLQTLAILGAGFMVGAGGAPLLLDDKGALYGIASGGSQSCPYTGCGSVFQVAPNFGIWSLATLFAFDGDGLGGSPDSIVGPDSGGGFYVANGFRNRVVRVSRTATGWEAKLVADFGHSMSGVGCLVLAPGGTVYGVAKHGDVFAIVPSATGGWTTTTLAKVNDHGYGPCTDILGPGGSLLGTVFGDQDFYDGSIFQLTPPASGEGDWTYVDLLHVGVTGRYGPINTVFGWHGDLYAPVEQAYAPPTRFWNLRIRVPRGGSGTVPGGQNPWHSLG